MLKNQTDIPMQVLILLITLILFITSSISFALTPLVGEDNFEVVCQKIEKIQIQSNKITKTPWENDRQNERFNLYFSKLIDLAFSSETRITFDADDIDNLLTVMEDYLFLLNDQPKSLFISWLEEDFSKLNKNITVLSKNERLDNDPNRTRYGCSFQT